MRTENRKKFIKLLESVNPSYRTWGKFKDFCEITARTMQMAFYPDQVEKLKTVSERYERKDIEIFDKMLDLIIETLTDGFCDFLGEVFSELGLGDKWKGQFFTPYNVCEMMSRIILDDLTPESIKPRGFVTISDPACGAGAMPISACEVLQKKGVNFQTDVYFEVQDIDYLACTMAYIQLSLCGAACRVVWGDSLAMKTFDAWYTPVFFLNDWPYRFRARSFFNLITATPPNTPKPKSIPAELPELLELSESINAQQLTFNF